MKNRILYLLCLLTAIGCTKFDDVPKDGLPESQFPENETQAALRIVPVYKELGDLIDDAGWWFWAQEVSSDEVVFPTRLTDWDDGGKWRVLHTHSWTNDVDAVNSMWSHLFDGVVEANKAIDGLALSATEPSSIITIAKLKTLRAFYYYLLIDNYGDVQYLTSYVNAPAAPFTEERSVIFAEIVKDLEESIPHLSVATNKFAVSRGMAFSLLAKLHLNSEIYTGLSSFVKAEAYCDSIINLGIYSLDQSSVTAQFSATNDGSIENIFTIPFDEFDFKGFKLHMRTLHYLSDATFGMSVGPWNGFAVMEDHYNTYDAADKRKTDWFLVGQQKDASGQDLFDETAGSKLIFNPYIPKLKMDAGNTSEEIRMSGARVKKYEIEEGAGQDLNNDFPLFRYADILLMKAECAVRNGGPGAGDSYVAEVRDRANAGPTTGFGLDEILAERGRELFCEGHRRQDLIRFGKFGNAWWEKPASGSDRTTFPIPQWAIDANPNLGL